MFGLEGHIFFGVLIRNLDLWNVISFYMSDVAVPEDLAILK